ncbi:MAG: tetratricopeptide repeat protein [Hyphomonadaceae bacterium]|nr:tetratricopeptide repeat protein [Hyphomonadaceae bacterium]MBC6412461.1 tetratricopeptide repeat protein [Hyphomonadaceae bacterium]
MKISVSVYAFIVLCLTSGFALAQMPEEETGTEISEPDAVNPDAVNPDAVTEDEVITYGTQNWGRHKGMDAFFNGDFETAEIEFEREFKGLKRGRSAIESAADNAILEEFRSGQIGAATGTTAGSGGPGGAGPVQGQGTNVIAPANAASSTRFRQNSERGSGILTDGVVTYQDFAFSKYMAGLSQIKLGKFAEAKSSLKSSLNYDSRNYDARMRLGLLYLKEGDFEAAAEQLEKLDDQRRKCNKLDCENAEYITESAVTLSNTILREARMQ